MKPYFLEKYGNASSVHSYGQEAKAALDESRDSITKLLHVSSAELFFVSSGTEANNYALKGAAIALKKSAKKNHIITTQGEHHAVLETCRYLEEQGFSVTYVDIDEFGIVSPEKIKKSITPRTGMISVMHVNNEVGVLNPIAEIGAIAKAQGIIFHSDAVQSFGKIPIDVDKLQVDLMSVSAHKIYGPKGIGALYIRKGVVLERLMHGGGQERGRRAGTENVPLAVGFANASKLMFSMRETEHKRLQLLRATFKNKLKEISLPIVFNGHPTESLPHIINISFDSTKIDIDGEALLFNLDLAGVAVTSGSACTSGSIEPSHVLLSMGRDPATAKATIRFSMGVSTTEEEIDYVVGRLGEIVKRIGRIKK
jgi:cysteine desulfurase